MRQGIVDVLKYYAVVVCTCIVGFLIAIPLGHGRGEIALLLPILFIAGAACWTLFALFKCVTSSATQRILGQVWAHVLILCLIGTWLAFVWI